MKASLKVLTFSLLLLTPFATAHAQGPSLSPIPNVSLNAGGTLNVNVVATDVDGRTITVTASLPPFATLNTPTIGAGVVVTSLTLAPSAAQVGNYTAAVTATAGGVSSVRVFQIVVNAAGSDQAPIVTAPPLQETIAGSALSFVVTAEDADGDVIASLSASGLPAGATFTPNGSNTSATFDWTPAGEDVGEYDVLFTATNALSGTSVTHLRVSSAPMLTITPIDDVTVEGGGSLSVPVHASGLPGELIVLTASLPTFATLNPPGTGTGSVSTTVTISPPMGSAGTYHASITATSAGTSVTEDFDIIVTGDTGGDNRPPVLSAPATATVEIGSTLSFVVTASDPDGDHVDLFGTALPPGSSFTDHANETGTFTWTPVVGQAGTYTASFTGLDNRGGSGSASTLITVTGDVDENHAPTLSAPPTAQVDEGVHLSFTVTASDEDGDHVALSANGLPPGATFTDHEDNTGTFSWTPDTTQAGNYAVAFLGSDGNGGTGTAATTITVVNVDGGGGGDVPGRACLIGEFKPHRDSTCFRITPVHHSFDLRDVVLTSIRLRYRGETLAALPGARIDVHCHDRRDRDDDDCDDDDGDDCDDDDGDDSRSDQGDDGGRDDDRDDDCDDDDGHDRHGDDCDDDDDRDRDRDDDCDDDDGHDRHGDDCDDDDDRDRDRDDDCDDDDGHDRHGDDCDDDDDRDRDRDDDCDDDDDRDRGSCGLSCKEPRDRDRDRDRRLPGDGGVTCDTLGIRACFSTDALLELFAGSTSTATSTGRRHTRLPCALVDAEILATLTNGATVVATFRGSDRDDDDDDDRDDRGDRDDDDEDEDDDGDDDEDEDDARTGQDEFLRAATKPNPLDPHTELSFTMVHDGRVQVVVYDMQGRLVKRLLDEFRAAGAQTVAWDGTDHGNQKVPRGVYFLRIQAPEGAVTRRVAVVN
jgi:hypothetical protein